MKMCGFGNLRWLKSYPAVPGMPSIIFIYIHTVSPVSATRRHRQPVTPHFCCYINLLCYGSAKSLCPEVPCNFLGRCFLDRKEFWTV